MHLFVVQRILGILLMLFSLSILPPLAISVWVSDGALFGFTDAFILTLGLGVVFWAPVSNRRQDLRVRDGFLVVVMFWGVLGLTGSLPFLFTDTSGMTITDAVFESVSGLTTTGATVINNIKQLPTSVLYYRQQLQWLGGMGIIVLAVAVLPMLGIGGMQLYRAETPGPVKDNKLTPRITETAKALWYIYLGLTISCMLAYWMGGMKPFDALGYAFSTVAIGGFSTHDESIGYYESTLIEMIAVVFMLLSGVNFALHFLAVRRWSLKIYLEDSEFRSYITILAVVIILVSVALYLMGIYGTLGESITHGLFQAVSIATTTGFTTTDYALWPNFISILLLFCSFVGGCAGSTGGGIKVIRFLLLIEQGVREINRLIHPNAEIPIRIGTKIIPLRVVEAVWGFFALYVISFVVMYLLLVSTGLDLMTSFSAVAASINNLGPGLGGIEVNYSSLNDLVKWILCFAMLLGRLEIFTLLVLLTPAFWRK
ncbi:MAG: TrkH family potassium uptake protein [Candidatus Thiodiazotropha sp. (ex Lucinoma aequizonata)]|nr:TrkH family potassium uptake protein [Candidatus Thiodiazotropha sp. (ex Lucinoma aequizonata)]MCU7888646.1 TrkH family potassium uptake protein [Candidatus Thiodiazotropha sp. (ex Lucinoma aequizonata)]MCU7896971.1 TrkH family potassium uptake protein [Candidatus Thiodiazotropha sp. (ex Lucinoma aequizonata)]MCU7899087.1 TrkH family potassium uptake protein [Candidatus Thiodiazotropha sp. (ex Lucinoma aequizonata)]MCU7902274.1 TrkH family potassium uptake protein [Candidatus Thiodiazotropha